jgi:hypothetical protein
MNCILPMVLDQIAASPPPINKGWRIKLWVEESYVDEEFLSNKSVSVHEL